MTSTISRETFYDNYGIDLTKLSRDFFKFPRKDKEKICKDDIEYLYRICNVRREDLSEYFGFSTSSLDRLVKEYGVKKDPKQYKDLRMKTNLIKYGSISPFGSKETKAKSVKTLLKNYGVENPSFVPEIRRKAENTSLKRYGKKHSMQVPELKNKAIQTNLKRYGVENVFQSETIKDKIKQSCIKHYGVDNPGKCETIRNKTKSTNLKKYGKECVLQVPKIQQKIENKLIEKYGTDNISSLPFVRAKAEKTNLKKYGVKNVMHNFDIKDKCISSVIKKHGGMGFGSPETLQKINQTLITRFGTTNTASVPEVKVKAIQTKRKNNTFHTSSDEEVIFKLLCNKFSSVIRQYSSEEYPFACDFYVPEKNLYLEYQGTWTHGKHPFNEFSEDDLKILDTWKNKDTDYYRGAIETWTVRDPLKRKTAKENNLNWIEFFNMEELKDWYNAN